MRSMFAFTVLALIGLVAFQYFKPAPPVPPAQEQRQEAASKQAQTLSPAQAAAATPATVSTATIGASAETLTIVENELYRITFTNRGALVKSWILKRYKDSSGHPLDLVNQRAAQDFGFPLSVFTYEPDLTQQLNSALYLPSSTGIVAAPAGVIFKYANGPLTVTKTFTFNESYVIDTAVSVTRNGGPVRALVQWPSGLGDQEEVGQFAKGLFAFSNDGKRDSIGPNKVSGNATINQPYD